ncbi:hypothetical protein QBC37DRAFT_488004 [Rhypophila decipiens]|uniref:Uncharacterized protein n=1 Tax=Rhypophila decipiens TaxID=261697 RepID=A0AAN6XVW9_9PEZI|nr:hypothetical protein QBC37DRAFT_488004 [Rhypophila decipiens]
MKNTEYDRVSSADSESTLECDELEQVLLEKTPWRDISRRPMSKRLIIILTTFNVTILLISVVLFGTWLHENYFVLNAPYRKTNAYSPLHDRIALKPTLKVMNATFWEPETLSIARDFSHEADLQWDEYELQRIVPVTSAQLCSMGVDPSTAAKLDDAEWGLGDDAYVAAMDIFHQLHCLGTLRRIAYPDIYPNVSRGRENIAWRMHVDHCVDILLQALQCSGNLDLFSYHWVADHERPFPMFSINRQCVDFEALQEWRLENTIDIDRFKKIVRKPEGVKELEAADDWYKFMAPMLENPNHKDGKNQGKKVIL